MQAIDPPPPDVWRFDAQECFWWIDDTGEMNIAAHCHRGQLFLGRLGSIDVNLSLVFDGPPAGTGRDYSIHQREARALISTVMQDVRMNAHAGVASVIMEDGGGSHGSFRIWIMPQQEISLLNFMPQKPGPLLCFGTFRAVKNAARGREIRAAAEAGSPRPPNHAAPATQPARS